MNIAVFSDIHGNYQALKSIINDIKKNNDIDDIICLGDSIGLGPSSKQCLDLILNENIKYVLGNHELYYINGGTYYGLSADELPHHKWIEKSLGKEFVESLKKMKMKIVLEKANKKMLFMHFFQNSNKYPFYELRIFSGNYRDIFSKEEADYIFFGHEHRECYYEINKKKYYCVGSSGCTRGNETFYHIIRIYDDKEIEYEKRIIKYDRESFENVMNHMNYPEKRKVSKIFFGL